MTNSETLLDEARDAIQFARNFAPGTPQAAQAFARAQALATMAQVELMAIPDAIVTTLDGRTMTGTLEATEFVSLPERYYDIIEDPTPDEGLEPLPFAAIRKDLKPDEVARLAGGLVVALGYSETSFLDYLAEQAGQPSIEPDRGTGDADNFDVVVDDAPGANDDENDETPATTVLKRDGVAVDIFSEAKAEAAKPKGKAKTKGKGKN